MKKILTILTTLAFTITIENCISDLNTITLQNDCLNKNNVHQSNNDFIFSDLYKNNKGEIYSITNDGIYKYTNDKNTFIKMKGINWLIISLKFDAKDNIYALKTNGIYKCLANKMKLKKMIIEDNYTPRSITIDKNNNIYAWFKNRIYKCLANEMEFKQMTGLSRSITNVKFDDKNNIYVLAKKIILINA